MCEGDVTKGCRAFCWQVPKPISVLQKLAHLEADVGYRLPHTAAMTVPVPVALLAVVARFPRARRDALLLDERSRKDWDPLHGASWRCHLQGKALASVSADVRANVGATVRADVRATVSADVSADVRATMSAAVSADVRATVSADASAVVSAAVSAAVRATVSADVRATVRADMSALTSLLRSLGTSPGP